MAYVAVTRAKDNLFLSSVARIATSARVIDAPVSRYLTESIPELVSEGEAQATPASGT